MKELHAKVVIINAIFKVNKGFRLPINNIKSILLHLHDGAIVLNDALKRINFVRD